MTSDGGRGIHRLVSVLAVCTAIAGCAASRPSGAPASVVVHRGLGNNHEAIKAYLAKRGADIEESADGNFVLENDDIARETLRDLERAYRARVEVARANLKNANVLVSEAGRPMPYKSRHVEISPDGASFTIRESALPLLRHYEPGHPLADSNGFVTRPNVQVELEGVVLEESLAYYRDVVHVLESLNPGLSVMGASENMDALRMWASQGDTSQGDTTAEKE